MKKCILCKKPKEDNQFFRDRTRKDGLSNRCKECDNKRSKGKPSRRFLDYRKGAKARSKKFSLTKQEFMKFWKKDCHYCGEKIETIGIDRIDNSKGYETGNIVPCCVLCNRLKCTMGSKEFINHCAKVAFHNNCLSE